MKKYNTQKAAKFLAIERGIVEFKNVGDCSFSLASDRAGKPILKVRRLPDLYAPVYAPTAAAKPSFVMNSTSSIDADEGFDNISVLSGKIGMRNPRLFTSKNVMARVTEEIGKSKCRRTSRRWNRLHETKRSSVKPAEMLLRAYQSEMAGPDAFIESIAAVEASMEIYRDDSFQIAA